MNSGIDSPGDNEADWFNSRPVWVRVLLLPLLLPVILFGGALTTIVLAAFLILFVPPMVVNGWVSYYRFWRRLRKRGQVAKWTEVLQAIQDGSGTLVVEMTPKGPGCAWLIERCRRDVDSERAVPSWCDFEERYKNIFDINDEVYQSMNVWSIEQLGSYESSARALIPSWSQLSSLEDTAKRESVIVLLCWCDGCLSRRNE